jgi:hypothetical protein
MNDLFRILAVGYLVRKFLAPKIYPVIDEIIEQIPELPIAPTEPEITITEEKEPITAREELLVDKGQIIIDDKLIVDDVSYPRRRA